jgi:hypothetical protein
MDMLAVENASAAEERPYADEGPGFNGSKREEARPDPDNRFQKAIAAWRGKVSRSPVFLQTRS